jgi:hypothetical protein
LTKAEQDFFKFDPQSSVVSTILKQLSPEEISGTVTELRRHSEQLYREVQTLKFFRQRLHETSMTSCGSFLLVGKPRHVAFANNKFNDGSLEAPV